MKKISLGQTINTLANLGVIAGIIFLGIEIRQTNKAVTSAAYQARSIAMMQRQDMLSESTYMSPILYKMQTEGWDAMTEQERARIESSQVGALVRLDGTFFQCEIGTLDESYCETVFVGEMSLWVPRWRDSGVLEEWGQLGIVRETFAEEIEKYVHLPPLQPYGGSVE